MKNILIATKKPFANSAIEKMKEIFSEGGYNLTVLEKYKGREALLDSLSKADGLIVRSDPVDEKILKAAGKLKIIVRAGAGLDSINVEEAAKNNIVVMNTPGQNSNAVAELAIGLMIYGARCFFSGKSGMELQFRSLGLHGFGNVSMNVFRLVQAFDMHVRVYTKYSKEVASSQGIEITGSLEELYRKSDIVSIHVPARGEHIKSVSYPVLNELRNGAMLINTSRKEVINEADLIKVMKKKDKLVYLSDVKPELVRNFQKIFEGRCYFTPKKIGAQTKEANIKAGVAAAKQIVDFFEKGDERFRVN